MDFEMRSLIPPDNPDGAKEGVIAVNRILWTSSKLSQKQIRMLVESVNSKPSSPLKPPPKR